MDDRSRKISCISPAEMAPPLLIRRRLSAPETIMRKYTLAQQRSLSQDSARSQNSDSTQSCNWPLDNSETIALRKKEVDIRKSTLMKRFWENSKSFQFPRTYSEWQYSIGKMKLSTSHSTPDHLRGSRKSILETSPKHKSISPNQVKYEATQTSPKSRSISKKIEQNLKNYEDSEESLLIYSSNFSNVTPTDSTNNIEDGQETSTTVKSLSTSTSLDPNSSSNYEENDAHTTNLDVPKKFQFVIKESNTNSKSNINISNNETTYTSEGTNLNVISNVELSTSTLNLIYNQIMQDVVNKNLKSPKSTKIINVQNLPGPNFEINKEVSPNRTNQLSEVNIGSPYKNRTPPLVPRLSAVPQTASMEVNTSSNESVEKESDTSSLVDSLEDPTSPKDGRFNHDEKFVRGELALLPDNSDNGKTMQIKKSSVFYIPMKNEEENLIKEANTKNNVSSLLPQKLKEKLLKRQIKLEEKTKEIRMRSFDRIQDQNGNFSVINQFPPKVKTRRPILPVLENKKEFTIEKTSKSLYFQQSSSNKCKETSDDIKTHFLPKTKPLIRNDKIIAKHDFRPTSRKIYNKTESKQIEILEVMEIVDLEKTTCSKTKSKIPILVQPKLPKIRKDKYEKPTFLDFQLLDADPKLDQLIANILIDTMQREDVKTKKSFADAQIETEKQVLIEDKEEIIEPKEKPFEMSDNNNYIEKTADSLTKQVLENNNLDSNNETSTQKKKKKIDSSKIPKGWITFYMLQKNNSPDSTSDEGPKKATNNTKTSKLKGPKYYGPRKRLLTRDTCNDSEYKSENESDSEVEPSIFRRRRILRENKRRWSVTVSGTGNGSTGPDLEMRLKFPDLNQTKQYQPNKHAHFEKHADITSSFPQLVNKKNKNHLDEGLSFEDVCSNRRSTEINISKQYLKNYNSTHQTMGQSKFEPRHTKTSQQRCLMNRQTHKHYHRRAANKDTNYNEIEDMLQNLPEFLVNGSAVSRDNKLVLSKICENDLKYLLSHLKNRKN